ncbi:MAG: SprT-like domain-containing protein [Planctomycetes bacterium]|nr:SprT-like domain-containing protein [Planctomycetota bacterium]MBL7008221.1 SprT-like domain-containing protein [Planctomycetota bacterium]
MADASDRAFDVLLAEWPAERLRAALDEVLELWEVIDLRAAIGIRWNSRLRTTIGRALLDDMLVELNPRLLARHPEQVRHVLVHEAAHLVVRRLHGAGVAPHGKIWKAYMGRAEESSRATHDLDVSGLRARRRRPAAKARRRRSPWRFW